jgi:hypothetical protein
MDTHENTLDSRISALTDLAWNCESETAFSAGLHPGGRKSRRSQNNIFALP